MAKLKFLGIAQAVSQVDVTDFDGTWAFGETARITINGKYVEYEVQMGDVSSDVAEGLAALAVASEEAEFQELTFTQSSSELTVTGQPGVPFTCVISIDTAGADFTSSTTVNATGPFHWNNAANWSTGSVPANSDEVFVELPNTYILYGFPTGLTLAKFVQSAGYVGLPDENENGYAEYRSTYLTISSALVTILGGQRTRISTESANSVVVCQSSNTVDIKTNHSSAQVHALDGTVRLCPSEAETAQASIARCNAGASLLVGVGATVATVLTAGQTVIRGAVTTLTIEGELCVLEGSATTVNVNAGQLDYCSTSTITTLNLAGGIVETRNDIRAKTITNFNMSGGQLSNPYRILTFTNGIVPSADLLRAQ